MKNQKRIICVLFLLAASLVTFAQDVPKFEVPVGFSFVNDHPGLTEITSFNVFGGRGGFVYNVTPWVGIKADFMGYTQGTQNNFKYFAGLNFTFGGQ